jgi:hypothetical protein
VLEHSGNALNWIIARVPFDVAKAWGTRGQMRVTGEIEPTGSKGEGFAFKTSLFPTGRGGHYFIVNKTMQRGGRVLPGGTARFTLEPDRRARGSEELEEWTRTLQESKRLEKFYRTSLNPSWQREIAHWISQPKSAGARERRADQMAERLMETMEAERELPPAIELALRRNPKARAAWGALTLKHRRRYLFAIFYYREPGARARRIEKVLGMITKE